jgi:hypothetical protein
MKGLPHWEKAPLPLSAAWALSSSLLRWRHGRRLGMEVARVRGRR